MLMALVLARLRRSRRAAKGNVKPQRSKKRSPTCASRTADSASAEGSYDA